MDDQAVLRLRDALELWQASQPPQDPLLGGRTGHRSMRLVGVAKLPQRVADLSEADLDSLCALLKTATRPAAVTHERTEPSSA